LEDELRRVRNDLDATLVAASTEPVETAIARLKSDHTQAIHALNESHALEIQQIHTNYQLATAATTAEAATKPAAAAAASTDSNSAHLSVSSSSAPPQSQLDEMVRAIEHWRTEYELANHRIRELEQHMSDLPHLTSTLNSAAAVTAIANGTVGTLPEVPSDTAPTAVGSIDSVSSKEN
jgi:hypothetical protein